MKAEPRFYFSQLSALAVIALAFLGWCLIVRTSFGPINSDAIGALRLGAFLVGAFVFCVAAIVLWRLLLVRLGLLSREEARGYPYSRPWERRL